MTRRPRRNYSPAFKARVALASMKGDRTMSELAKHFDLHQNQIKQRKDQLLEGVLDVFDDKANRKASEIDVTSLHAKIGQLTLENGPPRGFRSPTGGGVRSPLRCPMLSTRLACCRAQRNDGS